MDKFLKKRIELMIKRINDDDEQDNCLIIEGDTGTGKTNMSVGIAHEVSKATGRVFDLDHLFFDTDEAVNFAKKTREQIIIFDEPVFSGLKAEWRNRSQINLTKLLYTSRMKRHFLIFNLVKFHRFSDDIIEKAIAFIRVYKPHQHLKTRKFIYIPHKNISLMLDNYKRRHIRVYNKYSVYRGSVFTYVLPQIIDKEAYNKKKEYAIERIGEISGSKSLDRFKIEWDKLLKHVVTLKYPITIENDRQLALKILKRDSRFIVNARDRLKKTGLLESYQSIFEDLIISYGSPIENSEKNEEVTAEKTPIIIADSNFVGPKPLDNET